MGLQAMAKRPDLAIKFASVISSWASVEIELASALCEAMNASAEPFAAAFQALNSTAAQASVAEAAIKTVIDDDLIPIFDVLMGMFGSAKKVRDRLAHGTWGWCDKLPDALLWIDPKRLVMRESMFVKNGRMSEDGKTRISDCGGKHVITSEHVMIYEARDFDDAFERNKGLALLFIRFSWCIRPEAPRDASALRQLLQEPEIAEALTRREKSRQTQSKRRK